MLLDFFSPQMKMLEKDVHLILLEYLFSCGFECPTSYFFPKLLKKFKFELKSRNSHHDLSDFIFFPKFKKKLNLNPKVRTAIMTCPTSYFSQSF